MNFSEWWNKNGLIFLIIISLIFLLICWIKKVKISPNVAFGSGIIGTVKKRNFKKTENECRNIVENIFQKPFPSSRPDFLKNPETKKNLECDMMNSDLKLCVEYNGQQHYKHVPLFHTQEQFDKQRDRDVLKKKMLEKEGYTLLIIPYTVKYDNLKPYILEQISNISRLKEYIKN